MEEKNVNLILEVLANRIRDLELTCYIKDLEIRDLKEKLNQEGGESDD